MLCACPKLRGLSLDSNPLGDEGISALADAIEASGGLPKLVSLEMTWTHIGDAGVERFSALLGSDTMLPMLRNLVIDFNRIGDRGIDALARALDKRSRSPLGLKCGSILMAIQVATCVARSPTHVLAARTSTTTRSSGCTPSS